MLLKFAFQDFLDDRKFKNTTKVNNRNYQTMLGEFVDYCNENQIMNVCRGYYDFNHLKLFFEMSS